MAPQLRKRTISTTKVAPSKATATTKRQKTAATSKRPLKRQRRERQQDMLDLPVEILEEIFSDLHPLELLQVSRVNKTFKSIIIHNGRSLWISSFKHAGLDWSGHLRASIPGPLLAALIFDRSCRECGKSPVITPIFMLRTRQCTPCISQSEEYATSDCLRNSSRDDEKTFERYEYVLSVMPSDLPIPGSFKNSRKHPPYYSRSTFRQFWHESKNLSTAEFHTWFKEKKEEYDRQRKLCVLLYQYFREVRRAELEDLRWERVDSVVEYLCEEKVIHDNPDTLELVALHLISHCWTVWGGSTPLTKSEWIWQVRKSVIYELWDKLHACLVIPTDDPNFGVENLL